jgi:hypothetical protein
VPDTDQFRLGTTSKLVSASLKSSLLKLKLIFTPGTGDQPDFAARAALLRISTGDTPITTLALPGLQARGKKTRRQRSDGQITIGGAGFAAAGGGHLRPEKSPSVAGQRPGHGRLRPRQPS